MSAKEITTQWLNDRRTVLFINYPEHYTWREHTDMLIDVLKKVHRKSERIIYLAHFQSRNSAPQTNPIPYFTRLIETVRIDAMIVWAESVTTETLVRGRIQESELQEDKNVWFFRNKKEAIHCAADLDEHYNIPRL